MRQMAITVHTLMEKGKKYIALTTGDVLRVLTPVSIYTNMYLLTSVSIFEYLLEKH